MKCLGRNCDDCYWHYVGCPNIQFEEFNDDIYYKIDKVRAKFLIEKAALSSEKLLELYNKFPDIDFGGEKLKRGDYCPYRKSTIIKSYYCELECGNCVRKDRYYVICSYLKNNTEDSEEFEFGFEEE